jgi:hypothetical protein
MSIYISFQKIPIQGGRAMKGDEKGALSYIQVISFDSARKN